MLKRAFTHHPASVNETYGQHLCVASWFGTKMVGAGLACLIHAVFPFLFVNTGSATINRLHFHMTNRSGPLTAPPLTAPPLTAPPVSADTALSPMVDPSPHQG